MTDSTDQRPPGLPETTSRTGLLVGLALGLPVIAYGIRGVLVDSKDTHPVELTSWVIGGAVVNDLVIVPVAIAVAWVLRRVVPPVAWPPVRAALLCTAVLCAVGWPFVRGYGRNPTVPSLLDRNYATGLAAAVAVVWLVAAAWIVVAVARRAGGNVGTHRAQGLAGRARINPP